MFLAQKHAKKHHRIGRQIQKLRKEKGLTQEQLAEKLHISLTSMARIETAHLVPNLRMLYRIAEILEVKVKDLFPF
jgi:transcriptional regulator with XRE-family HTH domain